VAEYYPVESTDTTEDGGLRVQLRYTDAEWLVRLALGLGAGTRVITPADLPGRRPLGSRGDRNTY